MNKVTMLLSALLLTGSMASAKTLVTVNGQAITQADVNTELMSATQGRVNQIPPARLAMFKKQVLQQLIGKEIIFDDAKKSGILNSPEYKNEYNKLLNRMKKELAIQVWQKKLLGSIQISNQELKDYYKKNKDEFREKESVHARHILVKTKAKAEEIISELKGLSGQKLKEKFIELAKKDSTGPSGPKGGDLGYFAQGQMVPAFNSRVFSMKKGTITLTPVKTEFGYHVIYLEDKKPAMTKTFNEVKTFIEQRLKMEKFKKVFKQKMDELQKSAVIK